MGMRGFLKCERFVFMIAVRQFRLPHRIHHTLPRPATMIVCVCRRVSDRDIHRAAREGVGSFDDLQTETGVGTACGSCVDCALDAWDEACQCAGARASQTHRTIEIRAVAA